MMIRRIWTLGAVAAWLALHGACGYAEETATGRTTWFREAKWGVFTHFLTGEATTSEQWNEAVNRFDVTRLAEDIASTGAGYYVITLGQNSGHYCSPNAAYDSIAGIAPSKCAKRDLVADLYDALRSKGIPLMVYLPAGAPDRDPIAMSALEWRNGKYPIWSYPEGGPNGGDDRLVNFQRKWESVIREWSVRWGDKVSGWWFDGCYFPVAMYMHPDPPNFESFAAAARAGNPNSIVAFNPGVRDPITSLTPAEDYTAGEINDAEKLVCPGPEIDGRQYHMLSFLGKFWCQSPPRFTDEQVVAITKGITGKGGVVTWDVPILSDSTIPEPFLRQLRVLGKAMRGGETGS